MLLFVILLQTLCYICVLHLFSFNPSFILECFDELMWFLLMLRLKLTSYLHASQNYVLADTVKHSFGNSLTRWADFGFAWTRRALTHTSSRWVCEYFSFPCQLGFLRCSQSIQQWNNLTTTRLSRLWSRFTRLTRFSFIGCFLVIKWALRVYSSQL